MGKYEDEEKTKKITLLTISRYLFVGLATFIGAIVIHLSGLPDKSNTGRTAYAVGLIAIFLAAELGIIIHRAIRKRKEKSLPPGGRWPSEARSDEERRNVE